GAKQDQVSFFNGQQLFELRFLGFSEEFHDGRLPLAIFNLDKCQTFCPSAFREVRQLFNLAGRDSSETLCINSLDDAPGIQRASEDLELRPAKNVAEID